MKVTKHFSQTYQEARLKFLAACEIAGAKVTNYRHPLDGPEGRPIFVDIAVAGAEKSSRVLVLGSGTHGVEGYCGSGLQTGLLHYGLIGLLPKGVRLLIIHAINPYGFAWLRRFNEDNVDLNRNFVDHSQPYPKNPGYEFLAEAIAPKDYSGTSVQQAMATLFQYAEQHGMPALQRAVTGGQYTHPEGIHFGGNHETWSNRTLRTIFEQHLSTAQRIILIEFHTGLGAYGKGECIVNDATNSAAFHRARSWWGSRVKSTVAGDSVSARIHGSIKSAIPRLLPSVELTATSLEFGTFDLLEVFSAMQAENWLHNHGIPDDPRREAIKAELLRVFYPDDDEWKEMVWQEAKEVVGQALTGWEGLVSSLLRRTGLYTIELSEESLSAESLAEDLHGVAELISSEIIDEYLGLDEYDEGQIERRDAEILLKRGKYAAAKPLLEKSIENWEAAQTLLEAEGRQWIKQELVSLWSADYLELSEFEKKAEVEEFLSETLKDLNKEIEKMQDGLVEIEDGLAKWGEEKPVEVRYQEVLRKERILKSLWCLIIGGFVSGSGLFFWSFDLSLWWLIIPILISLVAVFWGMVVRAELNWPYAPDDIWPDQELRTYAKSRARKR